MTSSAALQIAKQRGCWVAGTASRDDKLARAREWGLDAAYNYKRENLAERVAADTGGQGVDVGLMTIGEETATMLFDYGLTTAAYLKVTPKNPTVNFPHVFVIDGTGMIRDDYAYSEATLPIFEGTGLFAVIDKLLAGK